MEDVYRQPARRRPDPWRRRWFFLFLSFVLLLCSWFVQPDEARSWILARLRDLRGLPPQQGVAEAGLPLAGAGPSGARGGARLLLFLPSRSEPGMVEPVEAPVSELGALKEQAIMAVDLLQAPPADRGLDAALPPGTRVLAVYQHGGVTVIDLSQELLAEQPRSPSEARQKIYSLVNTLTSLPEIESVRFLVGDEERTSYFNLYDLSDTYQFNRDAVAGGGAVSP